MDLTAQDRPLTVQEAYDALDAFGRRTGRVPLLLLMHAAVPQSFRADLVNLLKQNFLAAEAGPDMTVDADVLLSPLVQPAAGDYYRLDPEVRRHCVALLDAAYRDGPVRRSVEVAWFLLAYADALERQADLALDPLLSEYLDVQRWVAASFIDPDAAAATFARALAEKVASRQTTASALLGSITAAISVPLSGQEELLAYARGLDAVERGDADTAHRLLDWTRDNKLVIGGVSLGPGRDVLARLGRPSGAAPAKASGETRIASETAAEAAEAPGATAAVRINVPPSGPRMLRRQQELVEARNLVIARPEASSDFPPRGPRVVRIVGEDGMGKWTLANELVNWTDVARYFEAIIWLGEQGLGSPAEQLDAYARTVGVSDLIDDEGHLRLERFREVFASRRVLFVVEERTASDIVAAIIGNSGPACAVLHLVNSDRTDNPNRLVLAPLTLEEASLLVDGIDPDAATDAPAMFEFARGNPLLMRLAITGRRMGITLEPEKEVWETTDRLCESLLKRAPGEIRGAVRVLSALRPEHRTLFTRTELDAPGAPMLDSIAESLLELHLADEVGDLLRIHPRIRAGLLQASVRVTAESNAANEMAQAPDAIERDYVYLSYADADVGTAYKLQQALEAAGLRTRGPNRPDDRTALQVRFDISNASAMVVVLSEHLASGVPEHLAADWQYAAEEVASRRPLSNFVVPVTVDGITPEHVQLPVMIQTVQWGQAPGGIPSAGTVDAIRGIVRENSLSRAAASRNPPSAVDSRTRDFALVVSVRNYPVLQLRVREEMATGALMMADWLASPEGGGIPERQLTVVGAEGPSTSDQPQPSYARIEEALQALSEQVLLAAAGTDPPRRLYLCFCGAVVREIDNTFALLGADASRKRLRSVGVMSWRRLFSESGFAEVVFMLDGLLVPATAPPSELPGARSEAIGPSAALFSVISVHGDKEWPGIAAMSVVADGLRGRASDRTNAVTSESLVTFTRARLTELQRRVGRPSVMPRFETSGQIVFVEDRPPTPA